MLGLRSLFHQSLLGFVLAFGETVLRLAQAWESANFFPLPPKPNHYIMGKTLFAKVEHEDTSITTVHNI